jgi:hypothetical protein
MLPGSPFEFGSNSIKELQNVYTRPMSLNPLLVEAMPAFARELEALLANQGDSELATQVKDLRIVDRCRCGDDFCATFYTQSKPKGGYGSGHKCVEVAPEKGMIILDVVRGQIMKVEVLYRDEIRGQLHLIVP